MSKLASISRCFSKLLKENGQGAWPGGSPEPSREQREPQRELKAGTTQARRGLAQRVQRVTASLGVSSSR